MARTALTIKVPTSSGVIIIGGSADVAGDVANGNSFQNDGSVIMTLRNTGGSTRTLTIQTPLSIDGIVVPPVVLSVPTAATKICAPLPVRLFNQSDGSVWINASHAELLIGLIDAEL